MPELLALSSDENTVYINRRILIQFDLKNWREQRVFLGSAESVTALTTSQDKPLGLVGYSDGTLRLWDLVEQLDYQSVDTGLQPDSMAASSDGKYLLLGNMFPADHNLVLWDMLRAGLFGLIRDLMALQHQVRLPLARMGNSWLQVEAI